MKLTPYYSRDGVDLYHGDAISVLLELDLRLPAEQPVVIMTDPPWPNGAEEILGIKDAEGLWRSVCHCIGLVEQVAAMVVITGEFTDPRFLGPVPRRLDFERRCRLEYPRPLPRGQRVHHGDVGWVFGRVPGPGNRTLPERCLAGARTSWRKAGHHHPCPRNPDHMLWLVKHFTKPDDLIIDVFSGSGTTLWAARELGRRAIGIEIEERWCEEAVMRLGQRIMFAPESAAEVSGGR